MLTPSIPLDREVFAQPRDSSLTLRMTCRNHRIVILMSLGEEGSRFFSIQNHLCKGLLDRGELSPALRWSLADSNDS